MIRPQKSTIMNTLPKQVVDAFHNKLSKGVSMAERKFHMHAADEDSLTGGLGESLATNGTFSITVGEKKYKFVTEYYKVRGRGKGAPESIFGTDGIIQIRITNSQGINCFNKGLPFQVV